MLKKFWVTAVIAALTLAGCGNSENAATNENDTTTAKIDYKEELSKEPNGKRIVLITNNSSGGRREFSEAILKEKGFNVEWVDVGGSEATARVISEVENPSINVIWGPTQFNFDDMISAGALFEWEPEWANKIGKFNRNNGYSYAYETQPKLWLINPDKVEVEPKNINDLITNEVYKGKYIVPADFNGTSNRAIAASILGQYLDKNGELGVSDEGWKMMEKFIKNGVVAVKGEDKYLNMMEGDVPIIYESASNAVAIINEKNINPKIVYFDNGQASNVNEIGVIKSSDKEVLAESLRLANYLGSEEFLKQYASKYGNLVVNEDCKPYMMKLSEEILNNFKEQDLDWDYINTKLDDWVAKIQLEFY